MGVSVEAVLNRVSVISLVVGGIFFLYEGSVLVDMHRSNPEKIPPKIAVAGSLTILLGVVSLAFAVFHFVLDGSWKTFVQSIKNAKPSPNTK